MLKRPPARSFERSSFSRAAAVARPVSSLERSKGSAVADDEAPELEFELDSAGSAFFVLSFFLYRAGEMAKLRLCVGAGEAMGDSHDGLDLWRAGGRWERMRTGRRIALRCMLDSGQ